jgi:hypothetical protein
MSTDKQLPTFRGIVVPSSSGLKNPRTVLLLFDLEDECFLPNFGNYLPIDMA